MDAFGSHRRDLAGELGGPRTDLGGIAVLIGNPFGDEDLACAGANREVELAPG